MAQSIRSKMLEQRMLKQALLRTRWPMLRGQDEATELRFPLEVPMNSTGSSAQDSQTM